MKFPRTPRMRTFWTNNRLLPHGLYALGISVLAVLGWSFSLFQDGCDYARVSGPILQQMASSKFVPWLEFGMGAYREPILQSDGTYQTTLKNNSCIAYADEFIDGAWKTAKIFSFLALVIGGAASLHLMMSFCFPISRTTWRYVGYELLVASLLQTFSFCWFATDVCSWNTCEMYWGSTADIFACTCWYLAGIGVVYKYPIPPKTTHSMMMEDGPVESISTTAKKFLEHDRGQEPLEEPSNSTILEEFEDEPEDETADVTKSQAIPNHPTRRALPIVSLPPPQLQQTAPILKTERTDEEKQEEEEDIYIASSKNIHSNVNQPKLVTPLLSPLSVQTEDIAQPTPTPNLASNRDQQQLVKPQLTTPSPQKEDIGQPITAPILSASNTNPRQLVTPQLVPEVSAQPAVQQQQQQSLESSSCIVDIGRLVTDKSEDDDDDDDDEVDDGMESWSDDCSSRDSHDDDDNSSISSSSSSSGYVSSCASSSASSTADDSLDLEDNSDDASQKEDMKDNDKGDDNQEGNSAKSNNEEGESSSSPSSSNSASDSKKTV